MTLAPLPTFLQPRTVRVNLDTLVHTYDSRPATKLGAKAWEWIAECDTFVFEGEALLVPSATWSNTMYRATPTSCTCRRGRADCWHKTACSIVTEALAEDAALDLCDAADSLAYVLVPTRSERASDEALRMRHEAYQRSLAGVNELFS
jgi:hypothetical protein